MNRKQRKNRSANRTRARDPVGGAAPSVAAALLAHAGLTPARPAAPAPGDAVEAALERHKAGDLEAAEAVYRRVLAAEPAHARALHLLGLILHQRGRPEEAVPLIERSLALDPNDAEAYNNLGNALRKLGRFEESVARYRRAAQLNPRFAGAFSNMGLALREQGRMQEAARCFRKALAIDPNLAEAYSGLSRTGRFAAEAPEIERLESLVAKQGLSGKERRTAQFALGKYYDDCGLYERAIENVRAAHAAVPSGFDAAAHRRFVDRIIDVFSPELLAKTYPPPSPSPARGEGINEETAPTSPSPLRGEGGEGVKAAHADTPVPIFVLGMPRSGTTLVEQILASHPAVHGAGELNVIERDAGAGYPESVPALDAAAIGGLRQGFFAAVGSGRAGASRVTDKSPFNFLFLGLIAIAFPEASIVHCIRDPLDTCLSIYFTDFTRQRPFADDLGSIGHYFRDYERLMAHWRRVLPGRVLDVVYEELVKDQEAESRRLLDHCGLAWDDRCLAFFATERRVATPSDWQVRLPMYATSVGRWRHYDRHLGRLRAGLAGKA